MSFPYCLVSAQVTATDPDNHAVYVQFLQQGNEAPVLPARVLVSGPMDGLRIKQDPLPGKGTIGLVCAVNGDPRSLVWMGAIAANGQDAITTGPGNDFFKYESRFSGYYEYQDEQGNTAMQWPDNSLITVGTSAAPQLYFHRIGSGGVRVRLPVSRATQLPVTAASMPMTINHSTGTLIQIDAEGNVDINGVGNINVTGAGDINVECTNTINIGNLADAVHQLVDSRMVTLYNNHVHGGVLPGGSFTAIPATLMAIGAETTTVTFAN